jgi:hypothetical protein
MGRKRDKNHSLHKNNSIQDSEGNEENGYSVPDPNKTMINVTKGLVTLSLSHTHNKKKKSWRKSLRDSLRR